MKVIILKHILTLIFLTISYLGNAQLIDPFGKVITHEIKLTKLNDDAYMGAMEWTTVGIDSLQRFIVNGLDVKSPVMVRIISKAPDHNIDVSFHKTKWDKVESKISTNGDKFVDKVFRTMNTAGIGVSSKVAGIPYLIIVKVGLQFPSTKSLIRITDDKEEYAQHMRKMGFTDQIFVDDNNTNSNSSKQKNTNSEDGNTTLTHIVIGLLSVIIILLAVFLFKRKSSKYTTLILILLCSGSFCLAQSSSPKLVPISGQGDSPVFYEYQTQNVGNQNPIKDPRVTIEVIETAPEGGGFITERFVRIESNPSNVELSPEVAAEVQRRIEESDEQFDEDYRDNELGEETQGDQRTLPTDRTNEELDALRRQVRRLQAQVDLLSQDDEQYEEQENNDDEILIYCEDIPLCKQCMDQGLLKFGAHYAYMDFLQNFYANEMSSINTQIAYGNSLASIPGAGLGWGPILQNRVMPAVNNLKQAYSKKFDEYIASMKADLNEIRACHTGENSSFPSNNTAYEAQVSVMIANLQSSKIIL